jgi:hypothetical protein
MQCGTLPCTCDHVCECTVLFPVAGSQSVLHMGLLGIWAGLASFLTSNTVCDTLRLMSSGSPLPVAIVPGIPDPDVSSEDSD